LTVNCGGHCELRAGIKYYDLFASRDDIAFYRDLALKHGRKALEIGVGTGRVAIELAKAGVTVWGIDSSKYMLNVAKSKLRKEAARVRERIALKLGDMRNLRIAEEFPFCYLASATFEHCITDEDQRQCLTSIFSRLEDGGMLAFDMSQLTPGNPGASWWVQRGETSSGQEVVRTIFSKRNHETNLVSVDLFFDVYGKGRLRERYYEHAEARISSKEEMERLLRNVGFKICGIYGDFNRSRYSHTARKMIFVVARD